jgi:RNA polymerase sigma factor (sigma-70 family)
MTGGDRPAFASLYDRYSRQAFSLAKRICVAQELAEEVVQEVFLGVWRDPSRFDKTRASFATWLMTLVHHRSVDAVRREGAQRRRLTAASDSMAERGETVVAGADDDALAGIVGGQVREALHRLPEEQRKILSLAYFGGYTQNEVAALTGVPLGTVKSRTFAGLRRLRTLLSSLRSVDEWGGDGQTTGVGR